MILVLHCVFGSNAALRKKTKSTPQPQAIDKDGYAQPTDKAQSGRSKPAAPPLSIADAKFKRLEKNNKPKVPYFGKPILDPA